MAILYNFDKFQIVVLIKCIAQFIPKTEKDSTTARPYPLESRRIIGIETDKNYATYDLLLLLVVFFHR